MKLERSAVWIVDETRVPFCNGPWTPQRARPGVRESHGPDCARSSGLGRFSCR